MKEFTEEQIREIGEYFSCHRNAELIAKFHITRHELNLLKQKHHFRKDPAFISRIIRERQSCRGYVTEK